MKIQQLKNICEKVKEDEKLFINQSLEAYNSWLDDFHNGGKRYQANLSGIIDNNLTEEEAICILCYTGGISRWLNSDLRNGQPITCKCKKEFCNILDNSLNKVKSFNNQIVYRMDTPSGNYNEVIEWFNYNKGIKFNIPYFLSTSKENFDNSLIVWVINTLIESSYGKDISNICNDTAELEVLFKRDLKLQIVDVDTKSNIIFMKELKQDEKCNFNLYGLYHYNF